MLLALQAFMSARFDEHLDFGASEDASPARYAQSPPCGVSPTQYWGRDFQAEADSFSTLSKNTQPLPCFLARYMAVSARLISSSPVAPSRG